jgi:hypothetical protein
MITGILQLGPDPWLTPCLARFVDYYMCRLEAGWGWHMDRMNWPADPRSAQFPLLPHEAAAGPVDDVPVAISAVIRRIKGLKSVPPSKVVLFYSPEQGT